LLKFSSGSTTYWRWFLDSNVHSLEVLQPSGTTVVNQAGSPYPGSDGWAMATLTWGYSRVPEFRIYDVATGVTTKAAGVTDYCMASHPLDTDVTTLTVGGESFFKVGEIQAWRAYPGDLTADDADVNVISAFFDTNLYPLIDRFRALTIPRINHPSPTTLPQAAAPIWFTPTNQQNALTKAIALTGYVQLIPNHLTSNTPPTAIDQVGLIPATSFSGVDASSWEIIAAEPRPQLALCLNDCSGKGECCDAVCKCASGWGGEDCSTAQSGALVSAVPAAAAADAVPATVGSIVGGVAGFALLAVVFARVAKSRLTHTVLVEEAPAVSPEGLTVSATASATGHQSL